MILYNIFRKCIDTPNTISRRTDNPFRHSLLPFVGRYIIEYFVGVALLLISGVCPRRKGSGVRQATNTFFEVSQGTGSNLCPREVAYIRSFLRPAGEGAFTMELIPCESNKNTNTYANVAHSSRKQGLRVYARMEWDVTN